MGKANNFQIGDLVAQGIKKSTRNLFQQYIIAVPFLNVPVFSNVPAFRCSCIPSYFPNISCSCYSVFQLFAVTTSPHFSFTVRFLLLSVPDVRYSCISSYFLLTPVPAAQCSSCSLFLHLTGPTPH